MPEMLKKVLLRLDTSHNNTDYLYVSKNMSPKFYVTLPSMSHVPNYALDTVHRLPPLIVRTLDVPKMCL